MSTNNDLLRERLAAAEHSQWAHWTAYMLDTLHPLLGTIRMVGTPEHLAAREALNRWVGQIETPYAELTEAEKDSDREWADKVLAEVGIVPTAPLLPLRAPIVPPHQHDPVVGGRVFGPLLLAADGHTPMEPEQDTVSVGILQKVQGGPNPESTRLDVLCIRGAQEGELLTDQSGLQWMPVIIPALVQCRLIPQQRWVFTVGLEKLHLPELEIRGCPTYLMRDAADLLNHIANFMSMTGTVLGPGDTLRLGMGGSTTLQRFLALDPLLPDEDQFYKSPYGRLCVTEDPRMLDFCADCGDFHDGMAHVR